MAEPPFTVVATFGAVEEAEMAGAQLREAGITARLDNAQTISVMPMYSGAIGGVRIAVATRDATRAREILGVMQDLVEHDSPSEETEPGSALALREGDAWMRRAAVAGGLQFILPVVMTLYSIGLLLLHAGKPMSARGRRLRGLAVLFDAIGVALLVLLRVTCG